MKSPVFATLVLIFGLNLALAAEPSTHCQAALEAIQTSPSVDEAVLRVHSLLPHLGLVDLYQVHKAYDQRMYAPAAERPLSLITHSSMAHLQELKHRMQRSPQRLPHTLDEWIIDLQLLASETEPSLRHQYFRQTLLDFVLNEILEMAPEILDLKNPRLIRQLIGSLRQVITSELCSGIQKVKVVCIIHELSGVGKKQMLKELAYASTGEFGPIYSVLIAAAKGGREWAIHEQTLNNLARNDNLEEIAEVLVGYRLLHQARLIHPSVQKEFESLIQKIFDSVERLTKSEDSMIAVLAEITLTDHDPNRFSLEDWSILSEQFENAMSAKNFVRVYFLLLKLEKFFSFKDERPILAMIDKVREWVEQNFPQNEALSLQLASTFENHQRRIEDWDDLRKELKDEIPFPAPFAKKLRALRSEYASLGWHFKQ